MSRQQKRCSALCCGVLSFAVCVVLCRRLSAYVAGCLRLFRAVLCYAFCFFLVRYVASFCGLLWSVVVWRGVLRAVAVCCILLRASALFPA